MGKNTAGDPTLDIYTNIGNYDTYQVIGWIKVDADGVVLDNQFWLPTMMPPIGFVGSIQFNDHASRQNSLEIQNGLITSWTQT